MTPFTVVLVVILILGVNTIVWSLAGIVRLISSLLSQGTRSRRAEMENVATPRIDQLAVLIAAHNEAAVIEDTIRSVFRVPTSNVFVASDGSTDATATLAREMGAQVLELNPNRGKAGAIVAAIDHFDLASRFEVVMLLDADTQLSIDYFDTGLPMFADPDVVAVAGSASTLSHPRPRTRLGRILIAYRERVYTVVQYLHKYGQSSKRINVVAIVPGFASMYRSRILGRVDIAAQGLTIEDYNMTFEVHAKRLGRIAFRPNAAVAFTQDPDSIGDYLKQIRRWNLGFWQTVRRHGIHARKFWAVLALFIAELLSGSVLMIVFLPLLLLSVVTAVLVGLGAPAGSFPDRVSSILPVWALVLAVLVPDYLLTILATIVTRRPHYLLLGLAFPLVRVIDAIVCLRALYDALFSRSDGTWQSPARRAAAHRLEPSVGRSAAR